MNYTEQYIKALRIVNESEESEITDLMTHTDLDIQLIKELIEEGYLKGSLIENGGISLYHGYRGDFENMTSTVKGRIFQNELEQKLKEQTFLGKINKHVAIIIGFVLGISCNLIVEIVKHKYLK